ncbi:ATP-grasp domain-containing protein [Ideonella sp. DXS29W]|uniref:ATP-grasp domain-containing protein n=1 Tax=Ideonella lacteola TaxID=2984193 RepID=A0ABU9BVP7_9BURK
MPDRDDRPTSLAFDIAYLEELGNGRLRVEEERLRAEFERRGVPVQLYTAKRIQRRSLPLSHRSFVAGDMDAMHGAMSQLRIEHPAPNDYPPCLAPYLRRQMTQVTLGDVEHQICSAGGGAVFVKPATGRKRFTGQVLWSPSDFMYLRGTSRRQTVWCAEVVSWRSEFRVYVVRDAVVWTDHYAGEREATLDMAVVHQAVEAYAQSGTAPAGYAMDMGVLESGETALVEINDGFALGAYDIDAAPYTDLLIARWQQLLRTAPPPPG